MLTTIDNDDGDDDLHTVAADDDEDDERATEKPTQSINSYNADQTENNIAMAESYATVENFNKPDVSKLLLLHDDEKLNFPTTNKMHKKVLIKKFPLEHANQNAEEKAQKLPTYKCLAQLHNDISMLRTYNVQRTTTSAEELRKFPLFQGIHKQSIRYSFPCQLRQEVDIKSAVPIEHSAIAALCAASVHNFPMNASFKCTTAPKVSLKKFPTVCSIQNVNEAPQLTEFKCLAQLHSDICALRSHFSTSTTASTEDIGKFPLSQSLHVQNRRRCTFPCTSRQARELFNDLTTVGALKSDVKLPATDVLCVQPLLRLPLSAATETLQKFPLKNSNQINNINFKLAEVKPQQHFPAFICRAQMLDTAKIVGHTSYNKSKLHLADLNVFRKKAGLEDIVNASADNLEPLYYSSFPYISMTQSANFPIQKNASHNLAIPLLSAHTTQPYRNQNYDHPREIQVQLNQEQLELETTANSQMLEHSNYYLEQEQHINDAINLASVGAATAITKAKNTTESSSSQKNDGVDGDHHDDDDDDESNISVGIGGESTQMNINNRHNNESDEQYFPYTATPPPPSTPPTLENLELLVSYTIESAANHHNHHHRILSTSSPPCSDVCDPSSQEVPSPLNVNVSCSEERLTKETRPFFLEENTEAAASSTDLVTLPKYYDLNNTEVHEDLIENSRFATLSARVQANVQNTKRSQETEIAQGIFDEAMTLTEIEDSEILSEYTRSNSVLDENLNQQDIVGIEEQQSNEMKLEMKSARGSILSADAEATARRYTQLKNEQNLTNTRRSSVNTYGGVGDVGKSLAVGSNLTRSEEIMARNAQAPIENPQRRHSVKGNSTIGYKLGTANDIAPASATDRNTLRGTTLSGGALTNSAPTMTSSAGRNSLTGRTSRANDAHVADRINLKEPVLSSGTIKRNSLASSLARANDILATDRTTSLRGSALTATTTPATTVDSLRRSSLTSSILRPSETSAIVAATVDNSLTNISPKKYNRAPTKYVPSQESNDVTRSISLDAADSVLPARTLLRRQRRMRPQSSYDEPPESAIERLNRLRARISGALSEVKGVLKHYSTDAEEADAETEVSNALKVPTITAQEQQIPGNVSKQSAELKAIEEQPTLEKKEDGPVTFRFVKKVRRRSLFDEEEEDKEKALEAEVAAEIKPSNENETGTQKVVDSSSEKTTQDIEHKNTNQSAQELAVSGDTASKINMAEERNYSEISENKPEISLSEMPEAKAELEIEPQKTLPDDIFSTEAKEQLEAAKSNAVTESTPKIKTKLKKKTSATQTADGDQPKRSIRRASIAAVESSKIEPTIKNLIPLDIIKQRRPSDSEAIIKKKSAKVKTTNVANETDGDESMPKVKSINKVKRPSLKRANIATTTQVTAETITNAMTDNTKSTPATIEKNSSSIAEMQANNSNKDAPKTAATLATQLVIDDASLTIGQATVAIGDDSSKATKEALASDTATIATTLVSPLQTSEQSSQVKKSPTESQKLTAELLAETPIIVVDTKRKSLEIVPTEKQLLDQSEISELRVEGVPVLTKDLTAEKEQNEIVAESKKLINQKVLLTKVDTIVEQVRRTPTPENQQVNAEILKAPASIAAVVNNVITESTTESITTTTTSDALLSPLSVEATKAKAASTTTHSSTATGTSEASSAEAMPELQVKAAQVFIEPKELLETKEPFNILKENAPKKKVVILKKLVRKNSTEKSQANNKTDAIKSPSLATNIKDKSKKDVVVDTIEKVDDEIPTAIDEEIATIDEVEEQNEEIVEELPAPEKKKRKIKKKVIIKRQQRRLSISENTFFKTAEEEPTSPVEDIVEKPIEYVKVASDEEQDYEEIPTPLKPTKSCLKVREFQVGDLVMYAERYKKTQVRWKRGKVLERITSISYKLEIEGKEVPAHISYIKKYTGRKVNFGGKEYLEIDYEQIAEEEQKARAYSIWNMV